MKRSENYLLQFIIVLISLLIFLTITLYFYNMDFYLTKQWGPWKTLSPKQYTLVICLTMGFLTAVALNLVIKHYALYLTIKKEKENAEKIIIIYQDVQNKYHDFIKLMQELLANGDHQKAMACLKHYKADLVSKINVGKIISFLELSSLLIYKTAVAQQDGIVPIIEIETESSLSNLSNKQRTTFLEIVNQLLDFAFLRLKSQENKNLSINILPNSNDNGVIFQLIFLDAESITPREEIWYKIRQKGELRIQQLNDGTKIIEFEMPYLTIKQKAI